FASFGFCLDLTPDLPPFFQSWDLYSKPLRTAFRFVRHSTFSEIDSLAIPPALLWPNDVIRPTGIRVPQKRVQLLKAEQPHRRRRCVTRGKPGIENLDYLITHGFQVHAGG